MLYHLFDVFVHFRNTKWAGVQHFYTFTCSYSEDSDQSLRRALCWLPRIQSVFRRTEKTDQTARIWRPVGVFAGPRCSLVGNAVPRLESFYLDIVLNNPCPAEPGYACLCKQCRSRSVGLEAKWSGSAPFVIKSVNLYEHTWSNNLIGWQLQLGVAS